MAWTQADVDALDAAIKNGAVHVRFSDGKEVTYRSMDDLLKARSLALVEVASASHAAPIRQLRAYTSKGF